MAKRVELALTHSLTQIRIVLANYGRTSCSNGVNFLQLYCMTDGLTKKETYSLHSYAHCHSGPSMPYRNRQIHIIKSEHSYSSFAFFLLLKKFVLVSLMRNNKKILPQNLPPSKLFFHPSVSVSVGGNIPTRTQQSKSSHDER